MTREDAIKHLENMKWLKGYSNTTVDDIPLGSIIDDIIALLKEKEPRVMTLEEMQKIASIRDGAIWLEAGAGWYGKTWRCWTSRPTDEQREAAPWQQD